MIIAAIALFVLAVCPSQASAAKEGSGNYGPMPRIQGTSFNGGAVDSQKYAGKVLIVDVWASWCGPCRNEIPGFIELQKKYGSKGLQVIGISIDDDNGDHIQCAKSLGINYPSVRAVSGSQLIPQIQSKIGEIEGIPTTMIVNRQGQIVYVKVGSAPASHFESIIKKYL